MYVKSVSVLDSLRAMVQQQHLWLCVTLTFCNYRIVARLVKEKKSFGEFTNTVDYVAERLNWDDVATEKAIKYYPPLAQCSILKVRSFADLCIQKQAGGYTECSRKSDVWTKVIFDWL